MGSGKTEAALYAAYKQMDTKNGLYFALPTRITSDYIYSRVDKFFSKIMSNHDIKLIHGGFINPKSGIHDAPG
jgi:CRISPR-associated endonuclease/helicase Cas3